MIDREKVIDAFDEAKELVWTDDDEYTVGYNNGLEVGKDIALALLKEQERKKGSWDYGTKCSVCKGTIIPPKDRKVRANFCPWCGADMRDSYEQEGR